MEGEGATVWAGWGDESAIDEPRGQELRPGTSHLDWVADGLVDREPFIHERDQIQDLPTWSQVEVSSQDLSRGGFQ